MKILFYCPFRFDLKTNKKKFLGGIESLNIDLAKTLAKQKNTVYLATFTKKKVHSNNVINIPIDKLFLNSNELKFDSIISSNDAQIFNLFESSRKIFWMHNTLSLEKAFRKKKLIPLLTNNVTTVFVSKYLKNKTSPLYFFNKKKIISNFLTSDFILKKPKKLRKPIFVWSVQRNRGLAETIRIWINEIHPIYKNAKFHIYGVDKIPFKISQKALLKNNIHFFGKVKKDNLKRIYSDSMAMICLGHDETFCLNAIEANACGLPVISLNNTALNEIVSDNKNGFLIKNLNELKNKIDYVINLNDRERLFLIKNSFLISKNYHLKKILHNWLNILK